MKINYLLFLLAILFGCSQPNQNTPTDAPPDIVKTVILPYLSFAPIFIAQEEGYFKEQHIELEEVELQQNAEAIPQLLLGSIDVAAGILNASLINAVAKGETPKIVACKGKVTSDGCTHIGILHNPDAPVNDWKGRRVSVQPRSFNAYYLEKVLKNKGLTLADVEQVYLPWLASIKALSDQSVDLVVAGEPWVQRMINEAGAELIHSANDVSPDMPSAFVFYGPSFMKDRPSVAQRFMVAYLKGVRQYNMGKTGRNLEIMAKHTKLDTAFLRQTCWLPIDGNGLINEQGVMEYQQWMAEQGMIEAPLEFSQLWDGQFVKEAANVLSK